MCRILYVIINLEGGLQNISVYYICEVWGSLTHDGDRHRQTPQVTVVVENKQWGLRGKKPDIPNIREFLVLTAAAGDSGSMALSSGLFISRFCVWYMTFQLSCEVCCWRSVSVLHSEATPRRQTS